MSHNGSDENSSRAQVRSLSSRLSSVTKEAQSALGGPKSAVKSQRIHLDAALSAQLGKMLRHQAGAEEHAEVADEPKPEQQPAVLTHGTLGRSKIAANRRPAFKSLRKHNGTLPGALLPQPAELTMTDEQLDALQRDHEAKNAQPSHPSLVMRSSQDLSAVDGPTLKDSDDEPDDVPAFVLPAPTTTALQMPPPPPPPPRRYNTYKAAQLAAALAAGPDAAAPDQAPAAAPEPPELPPRASVTTVIAPGPEDADEGVERGEGEAEPPADNKQPDEPAEDDQNEPPHLAWRRRMSAARREARMNSLRNAAAQHEATAAAPEPEPEQEESAQLASGDKARPPPALPPRPAPAIVIEDHHTDDDEDDGEQENDAAAKPPAGNDAVRDDANAAERDPEAHENEDGANLAAAAARAPSPAPQGERDEDSAAAAAAAATAAAARVPVSRREHKRLESALAPSMEKSADGTMHWEGERRYYEEREMYSSHMTKLRERAQKQSEGFANAIKYVSVLQTAEENKCQILSHMLMEAQKVDEFATGTSADACWNAVRVHFQHVAKRDMDALVEQRKNTTIPMSTSVGEVDVDVAALFGEADVLRTECDSRGQELSQAKATSTEVMNKYRALTRVANYKPPTDGQVADDTQSGATKETLKKKDQLTEARAACDVAHLAVVAAETRFRSAVRVYEHRMPVIVRTIEAKVRRRLALFKENIAGMVAARRKWIESISDSLDRVHELTQGIDVDADVAAFARGTDSFDVFLVEMIEATRPPAGPPAGETAANAAGSSAASSATGRGGTTTGNDDDGDDVDLCGAEGSSAVSASASRGGTSAPDAAGHNGSYATRLWGPEGFYRAQQQADQGKQTVKQLTDALTAFADIHQSKADAVRKCSSVLDRSLWDLRGTTEARAWSTLAETGRLVAPLYEECAASLRGKANYLTVSKTEQKNTAAALLAHKADLERTVAACAKQVKELDDLRQKKKWNYDVEMHELESKGTYEVCKTQAELQKLLGRISKLYSEFREAETAHEAAVRALVLSQGQYELACGHFLNLFQQQEYRRSRDCADVFLSVASAMDRLTRGIESHDLNAVSFVSSIDPEADLLAMARSNANRVRGHVTPGHVAAGIAVRAEAEAQQQQQQQCAPSSSAVSGASSGNVLLQPASTLDLFSYMGPVAFDRMKTRLEKGASDLKTLTEYVELTAVADTAEAKALMRQANVWQVACTGKSLAHAAGLFAAAAKGTADLLNDGVAALTATVLGPVKQQREALKEELSQAVEEHAAMVSKLAHAEQSVASCDAAEKKAREKLDDIQTKYNRTKGRVDQGASSVSKMEKRKAEVDARSVDLNLARRHLAEARRALAETEQERNMVVARLVQRLKQVDVVRSEQFRAHANAVITLRRSFLKKQRQMIDNLALASRAVTPSGDVEEFMSSAATHDIPPEMVRRHEGILMTFLEMSTDGARHLEASGHPSRRSRRRSGARPVLRQRRPAGVEPIQEEDEEEEEEDADNNDADQQSSDGEEGADSDSDDCKSDSDGEDPTGGRSVAGAAASAKAQQPAFGGFLADSGPELPPVFVRCCDFLRRRALEEEGIFRLAAPADEMEQIRELLVSGEPLPLSDSVNPHAVACLLKQWVGALAEPLVPYEHYAQFMALGQTSKETPREERVRSARAVIESLPPAHRRVLAHLVRFLALVDARSGRNRMDAFALASVFAPAIGRAPQNRDIRTAWTPAMLNETRVLQRALQDLIVHHLDVFSAADE